jgi:hypothetical protein
VDVAAGSTREIPHEPLTIRKKLLLEFLTRATTRRVTRATARAHARRM